jgi:TPR repeat protein
MKTNRFLVIRLATATFLIAGLALAASAQDTNLNFQAAQAGADKGNAKSEYDLARCYEQSIGVRENYFKAAQYAQLSAQQGYIPGEILLGSYYGRGIGIGRSIKMAVQWYRKAADQGDAVAEYAMGGFYATGHGVTNDMEQAIEWWQKAAAQNYPDAEARLGQLYLVPEQPYGRKYLDSAKARLFLLRAAAGGSAGAMNNLGVASENGLGVTRNLTEAAKWFLAAAERGDSMGQANIAQLYFDGTGVPEDHVQAYKWFKLSANQGNFLGLEGYNRFLGKPLLTPQQTADAEELVQDFHPKTGGVQE